MRKFLLLCISSLLISAHSFAQFFEQPVTWNQKVTALEDGIYELRFIATVEEPWHMYDLGPYENGPQATHFVFDLPQGVALVGETCMKDPPAKEFDHLFGMDIGMFGGIGEFVQQVRIEIPSAVCNVTVEWQVCDGSSCLPPEEESFSVSLTGGPVSATSAGSESLWRIILQAIAFGLVALLTPCVFPMVPMTVSFFLRGSKDKRTSRLNAALYGIFIVLLYTLPIAVIIGITYFTGGAAVTANIFNWLATHWIPNIIFFLLFLIFAASFFGAFELVLPSKWTTKTDAKADRGGVLGTFFLALTLVLVSFSCTGPIVGTVLIESTQGAVWEPVVTMFAFSIAFALPFTILAFVPSLLQRLPKSGGWLNAIKVVLGFIVLALSLKFLSTIDQIYQWRLLDREVFLAIWIVIFSLLGFYLLGKIRFRHDSPQEYVGVFRLALAIGVFSFVVYLLPGMWGAPLKAVSGYLPPFKTQDFVLNEASSATSLPAVNDNTESATSNRKYSNLFSLPYGLTGFFNYEEAMDYAVTNNKPVFFDFTGLGCVNCKEMEARVWSDPRVLKLLQEKYVILALHSDAKNQAAESDWVTDEKGRTLKTLGKINSYFARTKYRVNAQPTYIILDHNGDPLLPPRAYDLDVEKFVAFLEEGLTAYNK